ncbi:MAG: DUF624 domain-containing protein [Eubacteriales bacterium]|jgi:uncharacterized membrane protein YesL
MPLLGYNFNKPGKGVDPNAPKKHPFLLFWELLGRKFFKYVTLNMMYFIVLLPIIIYGYAMFYGWLAKIMPVDDGTVVSFLLDIFASIYNIVPAVLHLPLLILSILLYGPFTCGLTYILRNYAREEHAFISDFFAKAKANFKQGLVFGLLDILAVVVLWVNFNYSKLIGADSMGMTLFGIFVKYFTIVLFIFYMFMRNYIYQMIVTIELSVRAIIKNAWLFAILGLGRNILVLIGTAITLVVVLFIHPIIEIFAVPLIALSFISFLSIFTTYPVIEKYIIKPAMEAENAKRLEEEKAIMEKLGNRGGELPPELGGPGAGNTELLDLEDNSEGESAGEPTKDPAGDSADDLS